MNYTGVCKEIVDNQLREIQKTKPCERGYMIEELKTFMETIPLIQKWRLTLPENGSDTAEG